MSAPDPAELARRLFGSVRRQRPSAALEARILAAGRAELEAVHWQSQSGDEPELDAQRRSLRASARSARRKRGRAIAARAWFGVGAFAAAAAALFVYWGLVYRQLASPPERGVLISAERSGTALPQESGERAQGPRPPPASELKPILATERGDPRPVETEPVAPTGSVPKPSRPERAPARSEQKPALPQVPRPSLGQQLEQIKAARAALRAGDHRRAIELLDAYRAQSTRAELAAEASLLRIEALAASGQREVAAQAARQFASDYPNSPLIDRALSYAAGGAER